MSQDQKDVYVTKGTRVRVRYFVGSPKETQGLVALAGMQMKVQAALVEFTGVVRHVRGTSLDAAANVHFWIEPDENPDTLGEMCAKCGGIREIEVPQSAIISAE